MQNVTVAKFLETFANISGPNSYLDYRYKVSLHYDAFLKSYTPSIAQAYQMDAFNRDRYACITTETLDHLLEDKDKKPDFIENYITNACCTKKDNSINLLKPLSNLWEKSIATLREKFKKLRTDAIKMFRICDQTRNQYFIYKIENFHSKLNRSILDINIKSSDQKFDALYDSRKESLETLGILPLTKPQLSKILSVHYNMDPSIAKIMIRGFFCYKEMLQVEQKNEYYADFIEKLKNDLDQYQKNFDLLKIEGAEMCQQSSKTQQVSTQLNITDLQFKINLIKIKIFNKKDKILKETQIINVIKNEAIKAHLDLFGASLEVKKLSNQKKIKMIGCQKTLKNKSNELNYSLEFKFQVTNYKNQYNKMNISVTQCRDNRNKANKDLIRTDALLKYLHSGLENITTKYSL